MGESEDMMKRLEDMVNLGARIQILEATIVDKNAQIEMFRGSLREKDDIIEEHIKARQEAGMTMADMDMKIRDLRERVGTLEDQEDHYAKLLKNRDDLIVQLNESLRNKISGPKEQADHLNAELREKLDQSRKEAEDHWALVLYAWSNLGALLPHKMKKAEDFRRLMDDAKTEILTLRGQRDELNLALQEWRSYREATIHYAWTQIGFLSMPETIMKAVLGGRIINDNLLPTVDEFRGMVDALRIYISNLNDGSPVSHTRAVVNNIVQSIERKRRDSGINKPSLKDQFMDKSLAIPWGNEDPLPENAYTTDGGPWNFCQFIGDPPEGYVSWDDFMRAKTKRGVQIKAIGDWKQDLSDAMRLQELEEQIDKLAKFIAENVAGEPSKSEGAVDCAIRLMKKTKQVKYTLQAWHPASPGGDEPIFMSLEEAKKALKAWERNFSDSKYEIKEI